MARKILLFLMLFLVQGNLIAQSPIGFNMINITLEHRNIDTLKLIYESWAKESAKLIRDTTGNQENFIKESYNLYPEIVNYIYSKYYSRHDTTNRKSTDKFYLLNSSITIAFSEKYFDTAICISNLLKISLDSAQYLTSKKIFFKEAGNRCLWEKLPEIHPTITINDFYASLRDDSLKIIFANDGNFYTKKYEQSISGENIRAYVVKEEKPFKKKEIRPIISYSSAMELEIEKRINFFTELRINIEDRIKTIYFQPDQKKAIVAIKSGSHEGCCDNIYVLFQKNENGWNNYTQLNYPMSTCSHNSCADNIR